MDDKTMRDLILQELDYDPVLDQSGIGVAVEDGVVTLLGHVGRLVERYVAERAASRIAGVRAIVNDIDIVPADAAGIDDATIAKRAADLIDWDDQLPEGKIQVHVAAGLVTLEGELGWNYQRSHVEDLIRKLDGVTALINHIKIKPNVYPADVKTKIKDALRRNALNEANSIHVIVKDGTVTLQGDVKAWHERDIAAAAAWSAAGVTDVIDQITIG